MFFRSLLVFFTFVSTAVRFAQADALATYVAQSGEVRISEEVKPVPHRGWALRFVSQTWQGTEWSHILRLVEPNQLKLPGKVLLFISGTRDGLSDVQRLQDLADRTGARVAIVGNVPNQPLFDNLKEDELLAYTFERYRKTGEPSWPALFPMVTAAVKAMDVIESESKKRYDEPATQFVVSGASKRGWTSWLVPLVDRRVIGTAPAVFDMLDMQGQIRRAREAYGQDSEMIKAYTRLGLTDKLDDPRIRELRSWIDPFEHRRDLRIPKLALLGANDPYWVVDSVAVYWDALEEPKLVRIFPNTGHSVMSHPEAADTIATWFSLVARNRTIPTLESSFTVLPDGGVSVVANSSGPIRSGKIWLANSPGQDFREREFGCAALTVSSGAQRVEQVVRPPTEGYRAVFLELVIDTQSGPLTVTTKTHVIPAPSAAKPDVRGDKKNKK